MPPLPPGSYDRTLPWVLPQTRDFLRGDAWAVPCPGLPAVPGGPSGGSSEHPERILTGLDYKYDRSRWWPEMVYHHLERGYTHWLRWWPNAAYDVGYGGGNSIQQFVDDCGLLKRLGMQYIQVSLGSKVFDPRDQSAQGWADRVGPVLTALLAAKVVDEIIPGFEWDSFNVPGDTTSQVFKAIGRQCHAAGVSCWAHFQAGRTWWGTMNRFDFWTDLGADMDGLNYQTDPTWSVPMMQARLVDTLSQFGREGNIHKVRLGEDQADLQFTHDHPDELDGALRGYLACCTVDNIAGTDAKVWGYGGGGMNLQGGWL